MINKQLVVYIASPVSLYYQPVYKEIIKLVRRVYPDSRLMFAKGLYHDWFEFINKWPRLSLEVDELVFFVDENDMIGRGVYTEIEDMIVLNKPVYLMLLDGTKIPFCNLIFGEGKNYQHYKKVIVKSDNVLVTGLPISRPGDNLLVGESFDSDISGFDGGIDSSKEQDV